MAGEVVAIGLEEVPPAYTPAHRASSRNSASTGRGAAQIAWLVVAGALFE